MYAVKSVGSARAQGRAGSRYPFLTQYERDDETNLDYAQARYFANVQGRFTSPDAYVIFFEMKRGRDARKRAKILKSYASVPQNWNRYSYCINDPVNLIDPTGLIWLTKDNENYQWVDDDRYRKEDWEGYTVVEAGTIAYFGEGWGGYADKYKGLMGSYVKLKADGGLDPAGATDDVAPDDPPLSSGYTDVNITYGTPWFIGLTGGVMFENGREYPYIGLGLMMPGPGASVMESPDTVSGGFNFELQLNVGVSASVGVDEQGNSFTSLGGGWPPGGSLTGYYVFGAKRPIPPGPQKPSRNKDRNCACNSESR